MDEKWAVVTGASSGIGMEIAKLLLLKGYKLILAARREERLIVLKKKFDRYKKTECCEIFAGDLSTEEGCRALFAFTENKNVEILINNAGFGECGRFEDTDSEKELKMVDLNVKSLHLLTKLYLQRFRRLETESDKTSEAEKSRFHILNVASSAGLFPAGPYMATYYATKAYVASLTKAIRQELKEEKSRIYIGALCPGPVDTEFNDIANVQFALKGISAKTCAKCAVKGMFQRKAIIVPSLRMKLAVLGAKIAPEQIVISMTAGQQMRKLQK